MADTPIPLEVRNIKKRFGNTEVLKGLSLEARKGDVITLIGASGSGKSTFLRCMNLLEQPNEGELFVHGEQIRFKETKHGREPADWNQVVQMRAKLSMVFQSFNLWAHMTLLENVIEAPVHVLKKSKKEAIEHARALLKRVGLAERADYYPAQLSGGQQQRGAIARALAMDPEVMLFDEPTSALDPELVGDVLKVMRDLAEEGRTMIVVTHEMAFARDVSSQVIYLHQGQVEEAGPPDQVLGNPSSERLKQFLAPKR
ncbi:MULTISPECIES: ATP-binding cassette domain-containing protein [Halomonas]|uniref:ATP-binding cassette domain-containing protein n=4 Tax=Pseudomonadota TaxID=1224 RepID=A0AAU7KEX6_9GAMM|nr:MULTISPECIES: ATP-binding cassette domain-containing protein [Halomonas]MBR9771574.1 ATP-binding cassette domain-containing protein [Gammaproteobacteria bacterium]KJZ14372.1 amino acid transporter [Halomonas sp. S2151]MAR71450.1 histidine/lysine/arginine/ornithine ABC transporter ATP-binding protein [Halomonas sp.]MBR9879482.1 ATP-binding cassette domain-containing protein [Gammaproteobacteria bacterium]MBS8270049.1 ATP-binding cassette domain-containing protein [Halomonas litopenaei]|tara:strand:+ start:1139 stop:1909 length:771 start_codon:yes stop_codon:yes gene_type:complete